MLSDLAVLQIDDELEFLGWTKLDRHFGRFFSLEDTASIDAGLAKLASQRLDP